MPAQEVRVGQVWTGWSPDMKDEVTVQHIGRDNLTIGDGENLYTLPRGAFECRYEFVKESSDAR